MQAGQLQTGPGNFDNAGVGIPFFDASHAFLHISPQFGFAGQNGQWHILPFIFGVGGMSPFCDASHAILHKSPQFGSAGQNGQWQILPPTLGVGLGAPFCCAKHASLHALAQFGFAAQNGQWQYRSGNFGGGTGSPFCDAMHARRHCFWQYVFLGRHFFAWVSTIATTIIMIAAKITKIFIVIVWIVCFCYEMYRGN